VKIETAFRDTYHSGTLQTHQLTDETLGFVLVGKFVGRSGVVEPLKIENAHTINCCLRLGSQSIDNFGRPMNEEFWTRCDYNDRKSHMRPREDQLTVEKNGVSFHFSVNKDNDMLYLQSITYRVDIIPKM
jgi:hypothetical protein